MLGFLAIAVNGLLLSSMETTHSALSSMDKTTRFIFPVDAEAAMLLLCRLAAACCLAVAQNFGGLVRVRVVCSACAQCQHCGRINAA